MEKKVKCPVCEEDIIIEEGRKVGEYIECSNPNCKAEMQIISLDPPNVSLLEEEK